MNATAGRIAGVSGGEDTRTRLIAMGSSALMGGFALIGFETWPEAGADDVERVLTDLVRHRRRALIFLEPRLARSGGPVLQKVRNEGGRIVICEVPPLQAPGEYHPEVEDLVAGLLGGGALEERR
jgi:vacuolar-type H+-ATPase subunit F/Vma7